MTIYLPTDAAEGIYNNVYYTTDLRNIVNEVNIQRTNAVNILNSINQSQSAPSRPAPEFDEFRQYIDQRITTQETLLQRIAQELGLDKPKQ